MARPEVWLNRLVWSTPYIHPLCPTGVQGFTPGRFKGDMGVQRVEGGKSKSPLTLWP